MFIWSAISWMVLPWHMTTLNSFSDETAITQAIVSNTSGSGIYILPLKQMETQPGATTQQMPQVFASVNLQGMSPSMAKPMLIGLTTQIIAAILVAWMLTKTAGQTYFGRVGFILIFALTAGIIANVPYWNWWGFNVHYTLINLADLLIGWFFAGLVMAKLVKA